MVHPTAEVQTPHIGPDTRVWQHTVILQGAVIGNECNINAHCFIENDVVVGNRVTLKCGVYLWDGIRIEDDVFVGPNVTFTNDKYPRSRQHRAAYERTTIGRGASLGAGAVILCGITIGEQALIGAGSVVTHSVPAGELWAGNPARFVRKLQIND